jgi:hypothetical protein
MFDLTPEFRHEVAAVRMTALQRSAERRPAGRLSRALGARLVTIGLRLGDNGRVPPFVAQLGPEKGPSATAGGTPWAATLHARGG